MCVFSSLMFLACQCNGASVVSKACCSCIALCKPPLLDGQVLFACMYSTVFVGFFCWHVHLGVHMHFMRVNECICLKFAQVTITDGVGEEVKGLPCCSSEGYL